MNIYRQTKRSDRKRRVSKDKGIGFSQKDNLAELEKGKILMEITKKRNLLKDLVTSMVSSLKDGVTKSKLKPGKSFLTDK